MLNQISDKEFEQLVFENQTMISKVCNIYFNHQAEIDELFQDIIINLWKGISSFQGKSSLSTWIYRVSINTAIAKVKKKRRSRLVFTKDIPERTENTPERNEVNHSRINALHYGINHLKPVEKAIILLYLEEKSYLEISEIIGISKSNVSVKIVRIKKKLRTIMQPLILKNE